MAGTRSPSPSTRGGQSDTPKSKTQRAMECKREALRERAIASELRQQGMTGSYSYDLMANSLEGQHDALLKPANPPHLACGEVVPSIPEGAEAFKGTTIADTLQTPDQIALDASAQRLDLLLADNNNLVAMAVDAANSINASNSLEKMLAHQLALAHKTTFELLDKTLRQENTVEQARLCNVAARFMTTFQQGLLTLQRLRTGGHQTVTVQHVTVAPGGQAVIGNVRGEENGPAGGSKNEH